MTPTKLICFSVSAITLSTIFARQIYVLLRRMCSRRNSIAEALFTNDQSGCCMKDRENCNNGYCMGRVYGKFEYYIDSAKSLICIAIYMFTNERICDAIIRAHKRGVIVRVIIDYKGFHATQSKSKNLYLAGIPIRTTHNNDSILMHHKFCLIDVTRNESFDSLNRHPEGGILINGSLNWTKSGISKNYENITIMSDERIKNAFKNEFDQMWKTLSPDN